MDLLTAWSILIEIVGEYNGSEEHPARFKDFGRIAVALQVVGQAAGTIADGRAEETPPEPPPERTGGGMRDLIDRDLDGGAPGQ